MKKLMVNSCLIAGGLCWALLLNGCLSVPSSLTPRFYLLSSVNENQKIEKTDVAADLFIGVGPVKMPEYLDRPQIVTKDKEGVLKFAQFDRWGESLDLGLARLVRENLTTILPGAKFVLYPWNPTIAVKYQTVVEIVQLESKLDGDLFVVAQWLVIDVPNSKTMLVKRSEFRLPVQPQNYSGLVKTLSLVCAAISNEIAEGLITLETK